MDSKDRLLRMFDNIDTDTDYAKEKVVLEDVETLSKDLKVLEILKRAPFILQKLFDNEELVGEVDINYLFGTITDSEIAKIKEWLER